MIDSTDAGKGFENIQNSFMIKNTQQTGNRLKLPQTNEWNLGEANS